MERDTFINDRCVSHNVFRHKINCVQCDTLFDCGFMIFVKGDRYYLCMECHCELFDERGSYRRPFPTHFTQLCNDLQSNRCYIKPGTIYTKRDYYSKLGSKAAKLHFIDSIKDKKLLDNDRPVIHIDNNNSTPVNNLSKDELHQCWLLSQNIRSDTVRSTVESTDSVSGETKEV